MSSARAVALALGLLVIGHWSFSWAADLDAAKAGISTNAFKPLVKDDRTAIPILAPASNEGEARIKQFKVAPGLKVDLWAAEPMLANPVAFAVDEKGRVFTSETYRYRTSVLDIRSYMFMLEDDLASRSIEDRLAQIRKWFGPEGEKALSNETEVIRLLEDTDGDHKADKSSVFADGFTSPLSGIASGVLARNGEVWFTEIPSLWRFAPALDGKSDSRPPSPRPSPPERGGIEASPAAQAPVSSEGEARPPRSPSPGAEGRGEGGPASRSGGIPSRPTVHLEGYRAEELLRGFGVRFSFTGHDLHGLKFGPDGRLYFSCGDRGAHIVTQEGTVIDLPDEGAVFRCEPDGSNLEVVHRGLRNPQELAFNEYGDLFTGDNDSDQGDRERWVQVIEGADSGWRVGHQHAPLGNAGMWNMERLWVPHFEGQAAYLMPPIANLGDGPSGLVYDYTGHYAAGIPGQPFVAYATKGRELPGNGFLLAYFKGTSAKSGIYSLKLRPAGATYELVAHDEFVWNSLVPDVDLTPDGAILFADWHEGWPKSNKGRLYRAYFPGVIADPVVQETAKLLGEGFAKRGEKELLGLLAHRDMRVRQEAQFELAARGPKSFDGLKKVTFESKNQLARLHAIWGIGQIARRAPITQLAAELQSLLPLLDTPDLEVVGQAARMLGSGGVARVGETKLPLLTTNTNPRLRYQATLGLRDLLEYQVPTPGRPARLTRYSAPAGRELMNLVSRAISLPGLEKHSVMNWSGDIRAAMLAAGVDNPALRLASVRFIETYLRFAQSLVGSNAFRANFVGYRASSVSTRLNLLLALRRTEDSNLSAFLSDPAPLLVLEAARAINDVPITNALPALAALAEPAKLDTLLKQFATLKVGQAASLPERSQNPAPAGWQPALRDVRADQPLPWTNAPVDHLTPMLLRVVNANFRVGTAETAQRLAALATRTDLPELIRTEAIFALGTWAQPHQRDRIVGTYRPLPERDAQPARETLGQALPALLLRSAAGLQPAEPSAPSKPVGNPSPQVVATTAGSKPAALSEAVLVATTEAAARLKLTDATPRLAALVKNPAAPANARAAALRAFSQIENQKPELERLLAAASLDSAEPLRLAASKLSAELNPNDAVGQLAAKLASGSLAEQQSAFGSLGDLKSDAADAILAEWLGKLMQREVANEVMLDLVEAAAKRAASAVKSRLETYARWKLPQDHLTPYREALFGGDAARGRKIFYESAIAACTRCHQIGADGGGNAGPKLDGLASRVTREHLLESLVFPNQQVTEGFATVLLTMKNGTANAGIVKSESETELTLLSPEEGEVRLKKSDVETRATGLSGMLEGMGELLSRQELRDVIEFLGTLK